MFHTRDVKEYMLKRINLTLSRRREILNLLFQKIRRKITSTTLHLISYAGQLPVTGAATNQIQGRYKVGGAKSQIVYFLTIFGKCRTQFEPINGAMMDTPLCVCIVTIVMLELAMLDLFKLGLNVNKEAVGRNSKMQPFH